MNTGSGLVLDANILIRAVFGKRARATIERFEHRCYFCTADVCVDDARRYIPSLCKKRKLDAGLAFSVLDHVVELVQPVSQGFYHDHEIEARERMRHRDEND